MVIRIGKRRGSSIGAIMAILAGGAVAAGVMLTPAGLLEMAATSSGISTIIPAAAPPLGEKARLILAFTSGVSGMAIVLGLHALAGRVRHRGAPIVRLGYEIGYDEEAEPSFSHADSQADSSPRRPIFMSTELGGVASLVETHESVEATTSEAWSELELDTSMSLPPIEVAQQIEKPAAPAWPVEDPAGIMASLHDEPSDFASFSITELVDRFEQGMDRRRVLIAEAVAAKKALEAKAVPQPQGKPARIGIDTEVDEALRAALGTLQKMTARAA